MSTVYVLMNHNRQGGVLATKNSTNANNEKTTTNLSKIEAMRRAKLCPCRVTQDVAQCMMTSNYLDFKEHVPAAHPTRNLFSRHPRKAPQGLGPVSEFSTKPSPASGQFTALASARASSA